MTTIPMPALQPLDVRLLPATTACDYERWQASLVNPGLLLGAMAVALYRLPLLAVPAGTERRGGSMDMPDPVFAEALICALWGRPGFERLTVSDHVVRWGEPLPEDLTSDARRRFYGLRKKPGVAPAYAPTPDTGSVVWTWGAGLPCPGPRLGDSPLLPGMSSRSAPR